jgi:hypothetical protein
MVAGMIVRRLQHYKSNAKETSEEPPAVLALPKMLHLVSKI